MSEPRPLLRELPSVDRLLRHTRVEAWLASLGREYVTRCCRDELARLRARIGAGESIAGDDLEEHAILTRIQARFNDDRRPHLMAVINATGTVLHTNLGRAL